MDAMTHYMEWLSLNQPWNLILFMLIPMTLAECVLASEIFSAFCKEPLSAVWVKLRRALSMILGVYFTVLAVWWYAVYVSGIESYRGTVDVLAVALFFATVIPALLLVISEWRSRQVRNFERRGFTAHVLTIFGFVLFTHLAMVFGMLSPSDDGMMNMPEMNSQQGAAACHEAQNMHSRMHAAR